MKPFNIFILLTAVLFMGSSGYACQGNRSPVNPGGVDGISVQLDNNSDLTFLGRDGRALAVCGDVESNTCLLFKGNSTLVAFEAITIIKFMHKVNPSCVTWSVTVGGKTKLLYDRNDPNCASYNASSP